MKHDYTYGKITQEEFDAILANYINDYITADELFQIPGVYELLAEHYNNQVLDEYADQNSHWKETIEKAVGPYQLYEYMTAEFGNYAGVYSDGQFAVGESVGNEIIENERPVALVKCPGIGNIDSTFWTEGWTEYNADTGEWIVTEESDGCNVGDRLNLDGCIYICCADGNVSDRVNDLIAELIESSMDVPKQKGE